MNTLDIIILIPIIIGFVLGFIKGLVHQLLFFVSMAVGIYASVKLTGSLSRYLVRENMVSEKLASIISFILIFLIIALLFFLIKKLLESSLKAASLTSVNKIAGGMLGALQYFAVFLVLFYFTLKINQSFPFIAEKTQSESVLYPLVEKIYAQIPQAGLKIEQIRSQHDQSTGL